MFSCLLEQEKEKRRRQPKGKESSDQNQPNNLSPSYISDLKSFWIALYASAATVLSLELLSLLGIRYRPQGHDLSVSAILPSFLAGSAATMLNQREMCGG
jgi:hypothetical protein